MSDDTRGALTKGETTYYDHDQSDTGGEQKVFTDLEKQQHVDQHKYLGDTDVRSDHNLSGTNRKATLTVPPGKTAGDLYIRRDYNWLEYFATEVGKVEHTVTAAREKLRGIDVKPGNFTQAHYVKTTTDKLKTDYVANLDRIQNAIRNLSTRCHEVAKLYKTSDELNNVKLDELKATFDQINGELGKLAPVSVKDKPAT